MSRRILHKFEKALYIHRCAYLLNLVLQDAARGIPLIRDVLEYFKKLSTIIKTKQYALFEKLRKQLQRSETKEGETMVSTTLCRTRWTVHATSMRSLVDNYIAIWQRWRACVAVTPVIAQLLACWYV